MPVSQSHSRSFRSDLSDTQVFGTLIMALKNLEWNLATDLLPDQWIAETGIAGASNNERIEFIKDEFEYVIVSESIGDTALHEAENESNTELLLGEMKKIWGTESPADLQKAYDSLLKRVSNQRASFFSITGISQMLRDQFSFREGGSVTIFLVLLNMAVFAAMAIAGFGFFEMDSVKLIQWGGNYTLRTVSGEYWRLVTNTFMHGGFSHLVFNLYGLFIGGLAAEELLGKRRFVVAYLTCAIFASAVSLVMHDEVLSVGASGAIFGCFGLVLGVASTKTLLREERNKLLAGFGIFVALSLISGLKDGVDNWAHIGGLACGWTGGFLYAISLRRKERILQRKIMDYSVPVFALLLSGLMVLSVPDSLSKFENYLVQYDQNTQKAFGFLLQAENGDGDRIVLVRDSGLYYVEKGADILKEAQKLKRLPKVRQDFLYRVRVLNDYRRQAFFFTYKLYETGESRFQDSVDLSVKQYQEMEKVYF